MGIAGLSPHLSRMPLLAVLLTPLQALVTLFKPLQTTAAANRNHHADPGSKMARLNTNMRFGAQADRPPQAAGARDLTGFIKPCRTVAKTVLSRTSPSRLKIVRAFEAGVGPSYAGRMVISGRMADVCAELDRMAQREAIGGQL